MDKLHREFMREAIRLAQTGMENNEGGPFGAIVVKDGKIIGKGNNRVASTHDPTAHAEVVAIRNACLNLGHHQLENCIIYSSCEPCPMCLGAIYWARPEKIYFAATRVDAAEAGFDDEFIYKEVDLKPEERSIPSRQILRQEGIRLFENWEDKTDKIQY